MSLRRLEESAFPIWPLTPLQNTRVSWNYCWAPGTENSGAQALCSASSTSDTGRLTLLAALLPALPRSRAGIPSQLTCQVQFQGARSSSADQGQFGHHHIWSIGI